MAPGVKFNDLDFGLYLPTKIPRVIHKSFLHIPGAAWSQRARTAPPQLGVPSGMDMELGMSSNGWMDHN